VRILKGFGMNAIKCQNEMMSKVPEWASWSRAYFVGAHSTGKTTLAKWVSESYSVALIPEAARVVLKEWGTSLDAIRLSPVLADGFQRVVFERQLWSESQYLRFVSDRAFDHLAYAAEYGQAAAGIFADERFGYYMRSIRHAKVFFVRPHRELIVADGVRVALDWESVCRIDGMVKFILKAFDVPFVELTSRDMDARVSTVAAVLGDSKPFDTKGK
jgi:nicotinamide riboside kinase